MVKCCLFYYIENFDATVSVSVNSLVNAAPQLELNLRRPRGIVLCGCRTIAFGFNQLVGLDERLYYYSQYE